MIATAAKFDPSHVAQARTMGFTDAQMIEHLDKLANSIGEQLAAYIKNGNVAWDGDLTKIIREADQLREFRKDALAYLLAA